MKGSDTEGVYRQYGRGNRIKHEVHINLKIMTVGSKLYKKKNDRGLLDTDQTAIIGATILPVRPPVLAVRWSLEPLFRWYSGRQDQSDGVCRSHYSNSLAIGPLAQVALLAEPPVLVVYLKYNSKLKKYDH